MHQTILPLIINHANLSNKLICRYKYQNMHRHIFYASIPMDEIRNINARMVQRHRRCANIPMNTSITTNVLISQLGTSCAFDSPGLASDSEVYPGSFVVSGNNAVGVVPFILWCFIAAFHTENAQHLRR